MALYKGLFNVIVKNYYSLEKTKHYTSVLPEIDMSIKSEI